MHTKLKTVVRSREERGNLGERGMIEVDITLFWYSIT